MDGSFQSDRLTIGDFTFRLGNGAANAEARSAFPEFLLMKTRDGVAAYQERIQRAQGIIELGIMRGGSCALFEALYKPIRHLALDICRQEGDGMDDLIGRVCADGRDLIADYDTSQANPGAILDLWGDAPIDLIVDDASHDYDLTVASFNGLFAKLRPGGVYVIEDWAVSHWSVGNLSPILGDLGRAAALAPEMVRSVCVTTDALFIMRGASPWQQFAL